MVETSLTFENVEMDVKRGEVSRFVQRLFYSSICSAPEHQGNKCIKLRQEEYFFPLDNEGEKIFPVFPNIFKFISFLSIETKKKKKKGF